MDYFTTIIGSVAALMCVSPFIFSGISNSKRTKQLNQMLSELAEKHGYKLTTTALHGDIALGLDEGAKQIFLIRKIKAQFRVEHLNLNNYKFCKTSISNRMVNDNHNKQTVIDKINLVFTPKLKDKQDASWEFFNAKESLHLSGEVVFCKTWEEKLNKLIAVN